MFTKLCLISSSSTDAFKRRQSLHRMVTFRKHVCVHVDAHALFSRLFVSNICEAVFRRRVPFSHHSHCKPSRAEPSRAEPNRFGLENKPMFWNGSIQTARRTELNRTGPSLFTGWCLFLLASPRPILLRNRSKVRRLKGVFFTVSANTLDFKF